MRFGRHKTGLDRGRQTHGAKWCFVTPDLQMLNYKELREGIALQAKEKGTDAEKDWKAFRKARADWPLFKSMKEAKRYVGLLMYQKAGGIRNLQRQVKKALDVRRPDGLIETIGHYVTDFEYEELVGDRWAPVVEETKGYREDLYIWKKRHFEAQYGVQIRES